MHDILKTDVARITKLDVEMFHDESWKPVYFGGQGERLRSRVTNNAGMGLCTLVCAGFF